MSSILKPHNNNNKVNKNEIKKMPTCFIYGCNNRSSNKNKLQIIRESEGCSITFHR